MSASQSASPPQPNNRYPLSSGTATNNPGPGFIETLEYRRFAEFCDACRRYGYIGLCFGPSGVGKTLSARHYSRWDTLKEIHPWSVGSYEGPVLDTVFYTPSVVNSPGGIQ